MKDTCVECGTEIILSKTAKWNQCKKCGTEYETLFNKQGNELEFNEETGHFYDPATDQEYYVEVIEVDDPDEGEEGEFGNDYLQYDPDEDLFVDPETGIGYDPGFENEDIEKEIDPEDLEEKTAYTMNLKRRYRSRGLSRVKHKQYYKKHKSVITRKHKMYKLKNRKFLKIRTRRVHHHYMGH
jgi:ribosomal protein S27AE